MLRIKQIMTEKIVTVELDDKLSVVKEIFDHLRFHHLLVVENGKLAGVLSDRDLLKALSPNLGKLCETPKDQESLNTRVHQIMSRKPITLSPEATLTEAVSLLINRHISCIPIVDRESKPIGIVSWRDLLKAMATGR